MSGRMVFLAVALAWSSVFAGDAESLPAETVDALESFYHHFDGDQWHNSEGWLDPAIVPCEWFGVECGSWAGQFGIRTLDLAGNNLHGDLSGSDIFEHVITRVDLSDNALTGTLPVFPHWLRHIHLSDNRLTDPLPEAPANYGKTVLNIDLARNRIEGQLPDSWKHLGIAYLDLSGNRLSGDINIPLRAADNFANLADNQFTGSLDHAIIGHLLKHNSSTSAGGINLCWNELTIQSEFMIGAIGERHVGGRDFQDCLARERSSIDLGISGSWFDPARPGEGISMHLLDSGDTLMYYFGFDGAGGQHWLFGVGREFDSTLHWSNRIKSTGGRFGEGSIDMLGMGFGNGWRMDRVGIDRFHLERTYFDFSHCKDWSPGPMPCPARSHSDRFDYVRLSRLAGVSCDQHHPLQGLSGAWFDPERSGEGFVVEVLDDGRGVVYWFTYQPDDSMHQAWMMGDGEFDGQTLHIDELIQPVGGHWGDAFDPAAVEAHSWGSLTLEFFDDDTGHVYWDSVDAAYGSGDHPIERLTSARLAECEDS